jgi:hypothetical protein
MLDRIALSVASVREHGAAGLFGLTLAGVMLVATARELPPREPRSTDVLAEVLRDEVCAFALAMPACWHTMVCAETLDWLIGAELKSVGHSSVQRPRSLGLTPRYMLRELDVPPLALPR